MGINYIYSYREDYTSKVSTLIMINKKKTIRDFSSILANLVFFLVYYLIMISFVIAILFFKYKETFIKIKGVLNLNSHLYAYIIMIILILIFSNLIFLLMLTLFNDANIAIALSLLYFVGGDVIAKLLESRISFLSERIDNSILTVFEKGISYLNQFIDFRLMIFLPLVLNIVGLVLVIFVVRLIKRVVS